MATAEQWLAKLTHLHVHQGKDGPAPHKPLLLLALMDLADEGLLPRDILPLTPELAFRFATYWTIVAHRRHQAPDVRLPFHHLRYDGTWSSLQFDGQTSPGPERTRYAAMAEDFVAAIREPAWRSKARRILIARYFEPAERVALYTAVGIPVHCCKHVRLTFFDAFVSGGLSDAGPRAGEIRRHACACGLFWLAACAFAVEL